MKNKLWVKRIVSIILTLSMLAISMAGCTKSTETNTDNTVKDNQNTPAAEEETASESQEEQGLPLSKEKVTLTMWAGAMNESFATVAKDYNENLFFQEMEKRTNVHIEFQTAAAGNTDAFNLMIASGDLPDLIIYPNSYQDGLDAGIDDGYYLDLTPYAEQYLPNYNKLRLEDKDSAKKSVTDTGRMAAVYAINQSQQPPFFGLMMRKDWLDDLGLEVPETVDEWETVLTAFKEKKGAYAPLAVVGALGTYAAGMNVAYSLFAGNYMYIDDKVVFGQSDENMRNFLTVMADWYQKGLIDPDFMTKQDGLVVDTAMVTTGQTGAFPSFYTMKDMYEAASEDPNMELVAVHAPVLHKGEISKLAYFPDRLTQICMGVSADSKNKEIAMRWLDYLYTEEGALLCNYGIENDTFTFDQDHKPVFTDKIVKNSEGLSMAQTLAYFTLPPSMLPCYYDWSRELGGVSEDAVNMMYEWGKEKTDYKLPSGVVMTSEENQEYASLYTDISTYTKENMSKFITGVRDINSEWDDYVDTIQNLGIDRCIEITQTALDRYMAR